MPDIECSLALRRDPKTYCAICIVGSVFNPALGDKGFKGLAPHPSEMSLLLNFT